MKTSPLHEILMSLGATFSEAYGWEMPANYGNAVEEHINVRNGAGIIDLSHRGKLRISGKDRVMFLQKILSQDINKIKPSTGAYSTLLDVKGKMLAYMCILADEPPVNIPSPSRGGAELAPEEVIGGWGWALPDEGSFLLDLDPGLEEKVSQILNRFLFRENVKIVDVTEQYGLLSIQGPLSKQVLNKITQTEVAEIPVIPAIEDMQECSHINVIINGVNCKAVKTSFTGEDGYNLYCPSGNMTQLWNYILSAGVDFQLKPFGLNALETLRIEAGIPLYSIDMDEHTIPVEANLDKAISYDKGCYIGQETIARIKFRGHVNKTLIGFILDDDVIPQKGDKVIGIIENTEHEIGIITSACLSPTLNRPIAMGYIRISHNNPDEVIHIETNSKKLSAKITDLPFHRKT
ncbi:MAG: aminomethyl transferase family protein [Nitrospirae bacterium]|nr:aminomethyl transferase family protein [Nitrospirota bacterium]